MYFHDLVKHNSEQERQMKKKKRTNKTNNLKTSNI